MWNKHPPTHTKLLYIGNVCSVISFFNTYKCMCTYLYLVNPVLVQTEQVLLLQKYVQFQNSSDESIT